MLCRTPRLPLAPYVECVWHRESGAPGVKGRDRVLPDGRFHLVLNLDLGVAAVAGLRSHHVVIDNAKICSVMGVVFRPGAARTFFAPPALDFLDRAIRVDLVWETSAEAQLLDQLRNARTAEVRLQILESELVGRIKPPKAKYFPMHPAVTFALRAFDSAPQIRTVADVSREVGWSRRWLSNAFAEHVGITPKRYCRLLRFQQVVRRLASKQSVDWADIALAGGFCDQAHLIHEFRTFSGVSPETFLASERPHPNHARIA